MKLFVFATILALASAGLVGVQNVNVKLAADSPVPRNNGERLFQLADGSQHWADEETMLYWIRQDIKFQGVFKVEGEDRENVAVNFDPLPTELKHTDLTETIAQRYESSNGMDTIRELSSRFNRYYSTEDGLETSKYLEGRIREYAEASHLDITVTTYESDVHAPQYNIVASMKGASLPDEIVIIGGHIDSINMYEGAKGRAPGADDDASGSSFNLESFRVLSSSPEFVPERTVEFHWYAAEEVGLFGSQVVAKQYKADGKAVFAMLQQDMTGYVDPAVGEEYGLMTDKGVTDPEAVEFAGILAAGLIPDMARYDTFCGYGCSDHASWKQILDARTAFVFETRMDGTFPLPNAAIHTEDDVIDNISEEHMAHLAKLGMGWAVELGMN